MGPGGNHRSKPSHLQGKAGILAPKEKLGTTAGKKMQKESS
jgi:hypothetical protein